MKEPILHNSHATWKYPYRTTWKSPIVSEYRNSHKLRICSYTQNDIGAINESIMPDCEKHSFMCERTPEPNLLFPTKPYNDSRCKSDFIKKVMLPRWVKNGLICYSKSKDGLYCQGFKFFPDTSGRRPKKLVSEPYCNWKDAFGDLKNHASCEYQLNSMMRLNSSAHLLSIHHLETSN